MEWFAIAWSGFVATVLSAVFFGAMRSFGATSFNPTVLLGCLLLRDPRAPLTESVGFLLLVLLGSTAVPAAYAALLPLAGGAAVAAGALLGLMHGLITAVLLPTYGMISACVRAGTLEAPGRFGFAWGRLTPAAVIAGHALYGAVVGGVLAAF